MPIYIVYLVMNKEVHNDNKTTFRASTRSMWYGDRRRIWRRSYTSPKSTKWTTTCVRFWMWTINLSHKVSSHGDQTICPEKLLGHGLGQTMKMTHFLTKRKESNMSETKALLVCLLAFILGCAAGCSNNRQAVRVQSPVDNLSVDAVLQPPVVRLGEPYKTYRVK